MGATSFSGPVESEGGFTVGGSTVIDSNGNIVGAAGSIGTAEIEDGAITVAKMAVNSVDSDQYVDGSIDTAHYAAGSVDTTALGASAVTTAKLADDAVTSAKLEEFVIQYDEIELTATEIVGTDAGDIGHSAGAELVAAEADKIIEFISAVLIYDFDTAAYTGGADDLVIRQGTTAVTPVIAAADLLGDTEDDIAFVTALSAADIKLTANSNLNLSGTAYTQPGTAAGTLRVKVAYRVHTAGLA